jgi:hypothetical protein
MLLGDRVKKFTAALGVQPCGPCQKRAAALNDWSRRSFLGRAVAAAVTIPLSRMTAALTPVNPEQDVVDLMRLLNTIQFGLTIKHHDHEHPEVRVYGSKAEMLGTEEPGLAWQMNNHPGPHSDLVNPGSLTGEIYPWWILDFAPKPDGYLMSLIEKSGPMRKVFVTDESVIIYRTDVAENAIPSLSLKNFKHAAEYPGAVAFDRYYSQNEVR